MSQRWQLVSAFFAVIVGSLALNYFLNNFWPTGPVPWAVFSLLVAVTFGAVTMPFAAYLNQRFARKDWPRRDPYRLPREGAWVGLFTGICAWMRLIGALDWTIAGVLFGVFALMEVFFITRK